MSAHSDRFAPASEAEVTLLVHENPLAWVITMTGADFRATPLPLRPIVVGEDSSVSAFQGHFARSNDHHNMLRDHPRALLLFMGVNGYVSPSCMHDRTQAPTWNYAGAQFLVDIEFIDDVSGRDAVLEDQVNAMEEGRENAWSAAEMGARYAMLANRVVAFRANIVQRRVKLKLGQDERDDVYADICAAMDAGGNQDLCTWMRRANIHRTVR
ncbi:MAG TPA: FMN-binding negative transcriptional regulator [Steroidobacteraceae bacterium]|nr:FMN-binding negative transcriptional regulator [Steroidobacteraceae bacterium]